MLAASQAAPLYPPTSDTGYAAWLKQFASQLPSLADRYQLTIHEIIQVQNLAKEFVNWLLYRTHCTTLAIQQGQYLAAATFCTDPTQTLQGLHGLTRVSALVARIQHHSAYCPADAGALGLLKITMQPPPQGLPPDGALTSGVRLPMPKLRAIPPLPGGPAPVLTWINRRDTTIELEVCRDGRTWQPLAPVTAKRYDDIYPPPDFPTQWRYRARYRWPDWIVGKWTRVACVSVGPHQLGG